MNPMNKTINKYYIPASQLACKVKVQVPKGAQIISFRLKTGIERSKDNFIVQTFEKSNIVNDSCPKQDMQLIILPDGYSVTVDLEKYYGLTHKGTAINNNMAHANGDPYTYHLFQYLPI